VILETIRITKEDQQAAQFSVKKKTSPRIWVVDDFYENPQAIRAYALQQEYFDKDNNDGGYIGKRTRGQYLFPGLKEKFEKIMGKKITRWQEYGMNGRFQMGIAGDPQVFHCDDQLYAGMLYLTPDAPFECGTGFYAHKATKIRHSSHPNIMSTFRWQTTLDATPYELVDVVGNVFNRLVLFDAHLIHSASQYFGWELSNCRLWQIFFFDAEV
jgi:hypothetical protein